MKCIYVVYRTNPPTMQHQVQLTKFSCLVWCRGSLLEYMMKLQFHIYQLNRLQLSLNSVLVCYNVTSGDVRWAALAIMIKQLLSNQQYKYFSIMLKISRSYRTFHSQQIWQLLTFLLLLKSMVFIHSFFNMKTLCAKSLHCFVGTVNILRSVCGLLRCQLSPLWSKRQCFDEHLVTGGFVICDQQNFTECSK